MKLRMHCLKIRTSMACLRCYTHDDTYPSSYAVLSTLRRDKRRKHVPIKISCLHTASGCGSFDQVMNTNDVRKSKRIMKNQLKISYAFTFNISKNDPSMLEGSPKSNKKIMLEPCTQRGRQKEKRALFKWSRHHPLLNGAVLVCT
jgi:hypothetical protein